MHKITYQFMIVVNTSLIKIKEQIMGLYEVNLKSCNYVKLCIIRL